LLDFDRFVCTLTASTKGGNMELIKAGSRLSDITLDNLPLPLNKSRTYQDIVQQFMKWNKGNAITLQSLKEFIESTPETTTQSCRLYALKNSVMLYMKARGLDGSYQKFAVNEFFTNEIKEKTIDQSLIRKITPQDIPTEKEFNELLEKTSGLTNVLIRGLYETGARVSELLEVKLSDCKKDKAGNIQVLIYGKGNKAAKKKLRYVFMTESLFKEIRTITSGKVYLFESRYQREKYNEHKPITRQYSYRIIQKAGQDIIKYDNLHPHTFRHYRITEIAKYRGIAIASEYAGHSSINITKQIYDHNQIVSSDILNIKRG
jgi:integrase